MESRQSNSQSASAQTSCSWTFACQRWRGAEATHQIRASLPDTQVLVLTTYADDESLFPALQAGARGYLTKDASAEEIERAIRALAAGRTHLDPGIQQRLVAAVLGAEPLSEA